jgi:hypothetical protein
LRLIRRCHIAVTGLRHSGGGIRPEFQQWPNSCTGLTTADLLHRAGPWAIVVATAGAANIFGIAGILRHYERRRDR